MKAICLFLIVIVFSGAHSSAHAADSVEHPQPAAPASPRNQFLSLDEVLIAVARDNPSLKAARANWDAMKQRVPQARAWEDLRGGFDTVAGRFVTVAPNSFTDNRVFLEQTLPLSGRNRLQGKAAEAEAMVAYAELRRRELDLTARARTAFYRLANAQEQLRLVDENIALLNQFERTTRAKYEAGTTLEADVLTAQTDLSKLQETRFDLLRQAAEAQSQLNFLMNRPADSPLPRAPELPFLTPSLDPGSVQALALKRRPELLIATRKLQGAKERLEAAKRQWVPDPTLRLEATRYNDSDQAVSEVMAGFSINLPWFNRSKYKAAVEEAKQLAEAAEFDLESAQNETFALVRDALTKVETYHHHVELFRDRVLPIARQNVTARMSAYETDKTGFLNLIDSQRTLQELEAMYRNHLTDYLIGLAELEAVVGADLTMIAPK